MKKKERKEKKRKEKKKKRKEAYNYFAVNFTDNASYVQTEICIGVCEKYFGEQCVDLWLTNFYLTGCIDTHGVLFIYLFICHSSSLFALSSFYFIFYAYHTIS
jgi:hypothetical protein